MVYVEAKVLPSEFIYPGRAKVAEDRATVMAIELGYDQAHIRYDQFA